MPTIKAFSVPILKIYEFWKFLEFEKSRHLNCLKRTPNDSTRSFFPTPKVIQPPNLTPIFVEYRGISVKAPGGGFFFASLARDKHDSWNLII